MESSMDLSGLLQQLLDGQSLTQAQASQLMEGRLYDTEERSPIPDILSGAILAAIQAKGVSAEKN